MSHWYDSTPKKSRRKRDSNPGSSALEADALPLGQRGGRAHQTTPPPPPPPTFTQDCSPHITTPCTQPPGQSIPTPCRTRPPTSLFPIHHHSPQDSLYPPPAGPGPPRHCSLHITTAPRTVYTHPLQDQAPHVTVPYTSPQPPGQSIPTPCRTRPPRHCSLHITTAPRTVYTHPLQDQAPHVTVPYTSPQPPGQSIPTPCRTRPPTVPYTSLYTAPRTIYTHPLQDQAPHVTVPYTSPQPPGQSIPTPCRTRPPTSLFPTHHHSPQDSLYPPPAGPGPPRHCSLHITTAPRTVYTHPLQDQAPHVTVPYTSPQPPGQSIPTPCRTRPPMSLFPTHHHSPQDSLYPPPAGPGPPRHCSLHITTAPRTVYTHPLQDQAPHVTVPYTSPQPPGQSIPTPCRTRPPMSLFPTHHHSPQDSLYPPPAGPGPPRHCSLHITTAPRTVYTHPLQDQAPHVTVPYTSPQPPGQSIPTPCRTRPRTSDSSQHCCSLLVVGCLTSQQHVSVSQGRICSGNCTCCHNDTEAADQTFYLTHSQYT